MVGLFVIRLKVMHLAIHKVASIGTDLTPSFGIDDRNSDEST